ncbi:septum formation initiator family protein [Saccharopolyspora sp. HNM0986]|nr:septum formation initiator family protein [Saccharopolyspora sp. HNM0986]
MPSGRSSDRQQRRRGGETPAARRTGRSREPVKRSGTKSGSRPRAAAPRSKSQRKSPTGGAFKLSSTRRAALLALLLCTMALSVSVPLRTYLSQRGELAAQDDKRVELSQQVQELQERKAQLSDPQHVETEARARLGYVRPGETPYIVELPHQQAQPPPAPTPADDGPWYENLWKSLTGNGQ